MNSALRLSPSRDFRTQGPTISKTKSTAGDPGTRFGQHCRPLLPDSEDPIGYVKTPEDIRVHIGADSLACLSQDGMMMNAATQEADAGSSYRNACFTGDYPIKLDKFRRDRDKPAFQGAWPESRET